MKSILIISFSILAAFNAHAYSYSRGVHGEFPHWERPVVMHFIEDSSGQFSPEQLEEIINSSVKQWSDVASNANVYFDRNKVASASAGRNEIRFSNEEDEPYMGMGVVGFTETTYRPGSGVIEEADIVLNRRYDRSFTADATQQYYIGNVITHEMGHVLGIGHSEVHKATMFYHLLPEQNTIESDDRSALLNLYQPRYSGEFGAISGYVIGDSVHGEINKIFGAHVEAISRKKGKVVAATFADDDGAFKIGGLPIDDEYYIYVTAPKSLNNLVPYYRSAKTNFCGDKNYGGSFFEKCSRDEYLEQGSGFPQPVSLQNETSVNVGNVTIKCDVEVPGSVRQGRDVILTLNNEKTFASFVGTARLSDFTSSYPDSQRVVLDLSDSGLDEYNYISIKTVTSSLYARGAYAVRVYKLDEVTGEENLILESRAEHELDEYFAVVPNGKFTVEIIPSDTQGAFDSGELTFIERTIFYQAIFSVTDIHHRPVEGFTVEEISDNSLCPSVKGSTTVRSYSSVFEPKDYEKEEKGMACGTIADGSVPPSDGMGGLMVGFSLITIVATLIKRRFSSCKQFSI